MPMISKNLAELKAAVGAANLDYLPATETVEFAPQYQDKNAFAYRLLYGQGCMKAPQSIAHLIWIYLVTKHDGLHEIQFVVFEDNDVNSTPMPLEGETVARTVEKAGVTKIAFNGITEDRKRRALAKYYFLALMSEWNCKDEVLKTPFDVTKEWVDDLKAVCFDFGLHQTRKRSARSESRARPNNTAPKKGVAVVKPRARDTNPLPTPSRDTASIAVPATGVAGQDSVPTPSNPRSSLDLAENGRKRQTALVKRPNPDVGASVAASKRPRSILYTPTSTRARDIEKFNSIREQEAELTRQIAAERTRKDAILEEMRRLSEKREALKHNSERLDERLKEQKNLKEELLCEMSHEEQLEFVHEAGQVRERKRHLPE